MTFEEAIKTAIEYEIKVRDLYLNSVGSIKDETGQRVFKVLGDEEQGHVDYLKNKLAEWQKTGKLSATGLSTVVPSKSVIDGGLKKLDSHMARSPFGTELEMLKKALDLEQDTSNFYRKLVAELKDEGHFFEPFLQIEDGHTAVVQAELDYLNRSGMFFDFHEFTQEH